LGGRGGRGRGRGGRGGGNDGRDGGRGGRSVPWEEDWNCTGCRASNFGRRTECYRCGAKKGDGKPSEPQISAMDETRSMMTMMFQQLEEQRTSINYVIDCLLEEVINHSESDNSTIPPSCPDYTPAEEVDMDDSKMPQEENMTFTPNFEETIDAVLDDVVAGGKVKSFVVPGTASVEEKSTKDSDNLGESIIRSDVNTVTSNEGNVENAGNNKENNNDKHGNSNASADNDDFAPASPDYTPLDTEDFEDTKPNIAQVVNESELEPDNRKFKCKLCSAKYDVLFDCYVHLQDIHGFSGDDPDVLEENVIQPSVTAQEDMFQCTLCEMKSNDMFVIFLHLENEHDVGDDEETLEKHVLKLGSVQAADESNSHTVEIDSGDLESDDSGAVHEEDVCTSASESVTNDPSRSSSPVHIETIEQLKEVMKKDKVKFVINDELRDSPEFNEIMQGASNQ